MKSNNKVIEDVYNVLYDYLFNRSYDEIAMGVIAQCKAGYFPGYRARKIWGDTPVAELDLFDSMMQLKEIIEQAAAASAGRGNLRKSMLSVLKNADIVQPFLTKAYYDEAEDCTVVSDSYQLIKVPGKVDGIPYNEPEARYFEYKRVIPRPNVEMVIPSAGELAGWIKTNRKNKSACKGDDIIYELCAKEGDFSVKVDARYLKNILDACGEGARCMATDNKPFSPIVIESADRDVYALIVPLRIV